jgi:hypothetical protein
MSGRPSSYTDAIAEAICEMLAEGMPMRAICRREGMPSQAAVYRWLENNEAFRERYVRAREVQAHVIAEQALAEAERAEDAQLGRLAFDARRWFAGKVLPKVYGDRHQHENSGPGGGPIKLTWGDGTE